MGGRKEIVDCYKIGNVYHPFIHRVNNKKTRYNDEWMRALQSIKDWA